MASPFVGGLPREDDLIGQHAEPLGQPRHRADECRHHADQRATIADQHRPKRPILIGAVSGAYVVTLSGRSTVWHECHLLFPHEFEPGNRDWTPEEIYRQALANAEQVRARYPRDVRFWA